MGAPSLVSDHLARTKPTALSDSPLKWMGTATTANVFKVLAAGEIVGDKLPMTPSRIAPGPLFGRILSGGLSGAALFAAAGKRPEFGAAIGAVGAVAGAFGFYHLRQELGRRVSAADPVLGAAEDVLAFGAGWSMLRSD